MVRALDALAPAVAAVGQDDRLRLAAVELAVPGVDGVRAALAAAADLPAEVGVWVEPGWGPALPAALELLRGTGYGLKLRTGGVTAEAFPTAPTLARAVVDAVACGVRFKATAGLHHAARHRDPRTGFEHHGFLNLLLAAARAEDGADAVAGILAEPDARLLATRLAAAGPAGLRLARDRFVSFGTCDVDDPRRDLERLALLAPAGGSR